MAILNAENLFLVIIGLIWIIGAVIQDLKRREVDNVWNFSLVAFVLAYRLSVSVFNNNYWFIINGILGALIFLLIGNIFYYSKLFAGGDVKLLIALGAILPLNYNWIINFKIFILFISLFLIAGSIYSLIWALFLAIRKWKDFKKEFIKQWKNYNKVFLILFITTILFILTTFLVTKTWFVLIGGVILLFPILFVFAKAIEESCMIKEIKTNDLTEGEWLYKDIKIKNKLIRANWEGISEKELKLIKKYKKKILIKQGIPFTPAFLLAWIVLLLLDYLKLIFLIFK